MARITSTGIESSSRNRIQDQSRSRAHKLLIELLSYQFAFPVKWIETQNQFLKRNDEVQRYIEVGPARILATMAKKTVDKQFSSHAASASSHLRFLSWNDDREQIYYEYPANDDITVSGQSDRGDPARQPVDSHQPVDKIISNNPFAKSVDIAAARSHSSAKAVADVALSASHILLSIVAQKLKRSFDAVSTKKTIRELSGGKSTLQNELIGDLQAEFNSILDGAEDMPLDALGEALQGNFSGKPGKQMSALISKFMSSKMPAGFNRVAIQDHLQSHWGISKDHATIPICFAVTAQPESRLPNVEITKEYLDSLIPRYASYANITLIPGGHDDGTSTGGSTLLVDSASLDAVKKEQKDYQIKQFELLAQYLQIDSLLGDGRLETLAASEIRLEEKLSRWVSEFDEEFFDGIQPLFEERKGRLYDSWWNWAREDLVHLFNDAALDRIETQMSETEDRIQRILEKWEPSCLDIVAHKTAQFVNPKVNTLAKELLERSACDKARDPVFRYTKQSMRPKTTISQAGSAEYTEVPRMMSNYSHLINQVHSSALLTGVSKVHIRRRNQYHELKYHQASTNLLLGAIEVGTKQGLSFSGKSVLVTGAGPKSIGAEIVQGLLIGGARVVVTTSRTISSTAKFYQQIYRKHGARGSSLMVLPFNQGSKKDCEDLVKYIYGPNSPTGGDLDYIVPFAAISETAELGSLDSRSELAHRAMLVNILRLLGSVRQEKETRGIDTRPTTVILPLSPNHGTFGGDGLYAESKLGLETLFNRFYSETWSSYITICGAVIGWVRGTGLMSGNNFVASAIEAYDVLTFSQSEMAFNILALMTPAISAICEDEPIYADLSGGLQNVNNIKEKIVAARAKISEESKIRKALLVEAERHQMILRGLTKPERASDEIKVRRANIKLGFPNLSNYNDLIGNLTDLKGMVDLSQIVVVVGFSDLSPWGSSRTRWEMEHLGDFTLEGYVEMAWLMGLVKHFEGDINGKPYAGWVDAKTKDPVVDSEFRHKYHDHIMSHSGIRIIEPEILGGYDPTKKEFLHEVVVGENLPPFESSKSTAESFKLRHRDNVTIQAIPGSEEYLVKVKKGAHFFLPKAIPFDRMVAGQLPTGWDPATYGIPQDIVQQVDQITLYALCCVSEALYSAGIEDPYEFYKYVHVSELANCLSTGAGPLLANRGVYKDRYLDRPVQSDILQESFLNTIGAWINMLLLSSTGPIYSPVGACATAIESLDIGCESIKSGKCKVAIVGGCDDFQEEMSYEFANMKATANSADELDKGRLPSEASRPSASSRSGFVESAGCGAQIIMTAELALEMGLPIYAIVAYTQMASDQIGRSVPAPGKGILTAAREPSDKHHSNLLDLKFRRKLLEKDMEEIKVWRNEQLEKLKNQPGLPDDVVQEIEATTRCKRKDAQRRWGNNIRLQDDSIAPMTASLATWGLTIDDIQVASMHGTSTKANDLNEGDVINRQMTHLGRARGNPMLAVCQKSLTGHPKGAAGAWQLNGCMQMLQTGIVPGNWNADNIDDKLRDFDHIVYPMESTQMTDVKATLLTSFGFGQKGGVAITIAPKFLFSTVDEAVYERYRLRAMRRQRSANTSFVKGLMSNSLFRAKNHSPWENSTNAMSKILLNPNSRVSRNKSDELAFAADDLSGGK